MLLISDQKHLIFNFDKPAQSIKKLSQRIQADGHVRSLERGRLGEKLKVASGTVHVAHYETI